MSKDPKEYYNNKYPKKRIIYAGRALPALCPTCNQHIVRPSISLDVINMITPDDAMLKDIIKKHNLKGADNDETMLKIQQYVCNNVTYVDDDRNQGVPEYWQFPFETIALNIGDCEDGAILMVSLAANCGIPDYRIRVTAGEVQQAPTAPTGGHGWCTYLRESDDEWTILDWCFWQDPDVLIKDKPIHKNNQYYKKVWFSFNHMYSWAHKEYEIHNKMRDFDPEKEEKKKDEDTSQD